MGFLTRLIAGLLAASTLGAGLAGTANAVDTNGATGTTKSVVKLTADGGNETSEDTADNPDDDSTDADSTTDAGAQSDAGQQAEIQSSTSQDKATAKSSLPDHLVNGDFEYPTADIMGKSDREFWYISQNDNSWWANVGKLTGKEKRSPLPAGFDKSKFAWHSTQTGNTHYPTLERADDIQVDYKGDGTNHYSEITAAQAGSTLYQDVATTPGVMYRWSLKHASISSANIDRMNVIIGEPGKETAQEATRTTVNGHGDKTGKVGTEIATKVSNSVSGQWNRVGQWETYTGTYIATSTVTRFAFHSIEGGGKTQGEAWDGNLLDDVMFDKAYKLSYDKNASGATGSVPSSQYGKENTTQPAKSKASGTVKTVADDTSNLPDHLVNGDFSVNYHDQWKDSFGGWTSIDPNAGKTLHATNYVDSSGTWKWTAINGWDRSKFGWTSTQKAGSNVQQKANAVELQYDDSTADNVYAELCAYEAGTAIYQDIRTVPGTLYKVRLKHASLNQSYLDKMQVMIGAPGHEQPVEMTRTGVNGHGDKLNEKSTTIATKVTNGNNRHHADQWETYEGTYLIPDGQTTTRFTFKSIDSKQLDYGNVLDDIVFDKAYRLDYDKNASDATGEVPSNQRGRENTTQPAKDKTSGSVKLVADDDVAAYATSNLPKQIMNGDFDHDWRNIVGQSKMTGKYNFANVDPAHGDVEISGALNGKGEASKQWVHLNGFDAAKFGWKSNQTDTRVDGRGGIVEIQRSKANDNMYAEITASQANTYLYQDIDTAHSVPTVYTVKLRYAHRNGTINSNEKIQVLVGAPGYEQPVEMTRIASDRGNKVGEKSTTVNAPNTDGWLGSWDTFQGSVVVPAGQNVSRFTFKALGSIDGVTGNLIDDVQFKLAYKLSYDKNANDASGSVPSDETANTVKQAKAKAKTTGTVKTVADGDSSKSLTVNPGFDVPDYSKLDDGGLHWMYVSPAEGKAWSYYDYINPAPPEHRVAGLSQATFGWQELTGGDYKTTSFELHREKDGNVCADVHGSRTIGQTIDTQAGVAYTVSIRHSGRSKGNAGSVQVLVGPDKDHLRPLEMSRMNVSRTGAKYGDRIGKVGTVVTTHSDSVDSTEGNHPAWDHSDDWETYSGTYVATGGKTVFAYRGVDKNGNADSVIDDLSFRLAYPLAYDKNAGDATGSVPSSQYGKENTVQPAKAKTAGTVRTVTDKTDGKVSDLVQRTTTHEDGSVTVKTIDTSTDVVSGCQVYYPAGQRITLATMAKDDDCWDSSMLTRPGHTQLGWNQDRNATAAQPEVTMVEGGMTVYAVWVGNPVLTYDTNKPNTWTGQMPSTPASISVPYNAPAADGSGWRAGDTTKIRGYRFLGWYTGPQDNAGLYDWTRPLTGSVTVYAHWQRLQANVVYNANGGTGSHPNTTGWQYSDVTIPGDTSKSFKRDKYVFKGWGTKPGKADVVYKDGSKVALQDKDITLYAQWQEVHENFVETGGIGLPIAIAGGVLLLMFGIGSTVMLTRRMNGHGMPDDE